MNTVPAATICPTGRSVGSLQVFTLSLLRAAAFPPMKTVALPMKTSPELDGGFWNPVPGGVGTWAGELEAADPFTAAGCPQMETVATVPPFSVPLKEWGNGVGTGPPGDGTITM